jgi:RNA polymerase sporulation-specific sigma factor
MQTAKDMSIDEAYLFGDVDQIITGVKKKCELKLRGKKFAGMENEDVVQEVLIKVHNSFAKYNSEKAKFSTYVDHVIENQIKDCYKKCSSEKNLTLVNALELEDSSSREGEYDDTPYYGVHIGRLDVGYFNMEFQTDIRFDLGEREMEIFQLRTKGYEFVEIAAMLGVSKARISQIWKGIKEKYEQYY